MSQVHHRTKPTEHSNEKNTFVNERECRHLYPKFSYTLEELRSNTLLYIIKNISPSLVSFNTNCLCSPPPTFIPPNFCSVLSHLPALILLLCTEGPRLRLAIRHCKLWFCGGLPAESSCSLPDLAY